MTINETTYPLHPKYERYYQLAEIVSPLLQGTRCEMPDADSYSSVQPYLLELRDGLARFLLYAPFPKEHDSIGVEVNESDDSVRWFALRGPDQPPLYHESVANASTDPDAWYPPELIRIYEDDGEMTGVSWGWCDALLSTIEDAFEHEAIPHEGWCMSQAQRVFLHSPSKDLVVSICKEEDTGRHLGFFQLCWDCRTILISPFIFQSGAMCLFASIGDALSIAQDPILDADMDAYTRQALEKCKGNVSATW